MVSAHTSKAFHGWCGQSRPSSAPPQVCHYNSQAKGHRRGRAKALTVSQVKQLCCGCEHLGRQLWGSLNRCWHGCCWTKRIAGGGGMVLDRQLFHFILRRSYRVGVIEGSLIVSSAPAFVRGGIWCCKRKSVTRHRRMQKWAAENGAPLAAASLRRPLLLRST